MYERISITGRVDLQMIQTETAKMKLSVPALRSIGKLIMFVVDECIPNLNVKDIFFTDNKYEISYLRLFGKQLLLTDEDGLSRFNIPAISILINGILRPHCDDLNPLNYDKDFTFSLSVLIPIGNVKCPKMRDKISKMFPDYIPLCLVAYRRRVVEYFVKYHEKIDKYVQQKPMLQMGRQALANLFNDTKGSNDYQGYFFKSKNLDHVMSKFVIKKNSLFPKKMLVTSEAVEKTVS